jgi:hypothetical protein
MLSVISLNVVLLGVMVPENVFNDLTQIDKFITVRPNHVFIIPKTFDSLKIMEQYALKNVNNHLNTNNYSYLETSGG